MTEVCVAVTNDLSYDQRMQRICRTLASAGYSVRLVGRELPDSIPLQHEPFRQVRLKCLFRKGVWFYAEYNIRLVMYMLRHRFDIGVACDLDTALAVRLASRIRGKVTVFDAHELFAEVPELEGRLLVKRIWSLIGRLTVRRHALRYTVGSRLAEVLSQKYRAPFEVVRNMPVSTNAEIPTMNERARVILYQGALNAGRGLETAIDAMEHIEGCVLQLAGEGDLSEALRRRVRKRGLGESVVFLGRILPAGLPELAGQAMIGLNLLEFRSQSYYYSLANKFFDYMHAGLPSINMDFPEYQALIEAEGVGVCIRDLQVTTLADAISSLMDDPQSLEQMHRRCLEARTRYTWEAESVHLLELFETLG